MIRMVVLTCLWKRPEVSEVMLDNITSIAATVHPFVSIETVAVGSEGDVTAKLAEEHGAKYLEYENQPLGAKWNAGLRHCAKLDPDAVMILGSDNIVNAQTVSAWAQAISHGYDYVGILDGYMFDRMTRRLIHWDGYRRHREGEPIGSARCYSRQLLDRMGWVLWDSGLSTCLDLSVTKRLNEHQMMRGAWRMNVHGIRHLGIKGSENIGKFSMLVRNAADRVTNLPPESILEWFGEAIGRRILDLPKPDPLPEAHPASPVALKEQIREELANTVICPRCCAVVDVRRVVTMTKLRPKERFVCRACAGKNQEEVERQRARRVPTPSDFLPEVHIGLAAPPADGAGDGAMPGGETPDREVEGGAGEFDPIGGGQ